MPIEGKKVSLSTLAKLLNKEPQKGWENLFVNRVCSPESVQNPCAVVISEKKHLGELKTLQTLLVAKEGLLPPELKEKTNTLEVENPRLALALIMREIYPENHPVGISPKATLGEGVKIGKGVFIGDFTYIGNNVTLENNVKIYPGCYIGDNTFVGEGTVIYPNAVIFPNTVIGKNVKIYPGAVIGREGFGFVTYRGKHIKIPHAGVVVIEDNAEIGANSCVDRALLEQTTIGEDTKIDNLVQVGHNCQLGKGVILVSQVGLSGSVTVGDYSILAGQVGVADHVKIGREVIVTAKSGVAKDLQDRKVYGANLPAIEWSKWKRIYALLLKLPELFQKIRRLSK